MNAREAAARAAVLKTLYDKVKDAYATARTDVMDHLDPGDRKHAVLDDGSDLGTVSVNRGRITARVVDEAAFTAWVREHRPGEIVETVRESYRTHLLKQCADNGAPVIGEAEVNDDGEITSGEPVDGVDVSAGEPYVSVRQTADQKRAVTDAHYAGHIADVLHDQPEIEGGS